MSLTTIGDIFRKENDMKNKQPIFHKITTDISFYIDVEIGKKYFRNAMKCVLYRDENTILIGDIFVEGDTEGFFGFLQHYTKYINKGYGTQMMNMLLEFAKENGYRKIVGKLSDVDDNDSIDPEHRKRQIHFYKKFCFKILPNEETPNAIELILE